MSIHIYNKVNLNMNYLLKCLHYIMNIFGLIWYIDWEMHATMILLYIALFLMNISNVLEDKSTTC